MLNNFLGDRLMVCYFRSIEESNRLDTVQHMQCQIKVSCEQLDFRKTIKPGEWERFTTKMEEFFAEVQIKLSKKQM